ncbi:MAG: hypothetical protein NVS4B12_25270 [Ktedonobacteraceae bacterium]
MSISTQSPKVAASSSQPRRLWRVPRSKVWWLSLFTAILLYGLILLYFVNTRGFSDKPGTGTLPRFGIIAFFLLPVPLAYTLRRRFFRMLPGKAQNWLWVHNWMGIVILLTVMLHANFYDVLRGYCYSSMCLSSYYGGPIALDGLFLLIISGIIGRLLDWWLARTIVQEASGNGVGIVEVLQERLCELDYTVERLFAGKSEPFKQYCQVALAPDRSSTLSYPSLPPWEQADFQRASEELAERARLQQSLQRQQHARWLMRRWRTVHRMLACVALCAIGLHLGWLALHVLGMRFHLP